MSLTSKIFRLGLAAAAVLAVPTAAAQGVLIVETDPAGAVVTVDGDAVGSAPVTVEVAGGAHVVRARLGGYAAAEQEARVADGDTLRLTLTLVRQTGRIRLAGLPEGSHVTAPDWTLDGLEGEAPSGRRRVEVTTPDGTRLAARVQVEPGAVTTVRYDPGAFTPTRFLVNVVAPGGAQIAGGRPLVGGAYLVGVGAAVVFAVAQIPEVAASDDLYIEARQAYDNAITEADAVASWARVEAAYDRNRTAHARLQQAVVAGAALYAVSLVDGALFHSRRPRLVAGAPTRAVAWEVAPAPDGLALRLRF